MLTRLARRMMGRQLFIVTTLALAFGLLAGTAMAQTGALQGTVTDVDGVAIEGAMVVARGMMGGPDGHGGHHPPGGGGHHPPRYAFTDAAGVYAIADIPAGDYHVVCGKPGYVMATAEVTIVEGQTTTQDFALQPMVFGSVGGVVTDAVTLLPIQGAHVMLRPAQAPELKAGRNVDGGGGMWLHGVTGADGTYLIENVPVGSYEARAMSFGYLPSAPVPVTVEEGVQAAADFALSPLTFGSLEGHVSDAVSGEPIEGVFVVACRFGFDGPTSGEAVANAKGMGGGWNVAITDADGFYHFDQLPVGDWTVRAFAWGYDPGMAEVVIEADATTVEDFALTPR